MKVGILRNVKEDDRLWIPEAGKFVKNTRQLRDVVDGLSEEAVMNYLRKKVFSGWIEANYQAKKLVSGIEKSDSKERLLQNLDRAIIEEETRLRQLRDEKFKKAKALQDEELRRRRKGDVKEVKGVSDSDERVEGKGEIVESRSEGVKRPPTPKQVKPCLVDELIDDIVEVYGWKEKQ